MKNLINQIIKFGIVGVIAFIIDFVITMIIYSLLNRFTNLSLELSSMIGSFFGFTISVIVNYILSMKYVFVRNEELDRKKEFTIFIVLSIIGLIINEIVIYLCTKTIYGNIRFIRDLFNEDMFVALSKMFATGIVMVYNFITRKIFIEKK